MDADEVDNAGADALRGTDDRAGMERRFKYDRGLVDYVEHLNRRKDKANPTHHQLRGGDARSRPRTT